MLNLINSKIKLPHIQLLGVSYFPFCETEKGTSDSYQTTVNIAFLTVRQPYP